MTVSLLSASLLLIEYLIFLLTCPSSSFQRPFSGISRIKSIPLCGTKYTLTAFALEDLIYDGGGSHLNNKYYYSLAGHLFGLNTGSILFLFSDALGSVVASISNTANSALVKGNQVYGPYGNNPYSKGTMGTTKGYTGQYNDVLTQLDYYNARYYDPLVGIFLSADKVQGNVQGMNPYMYVGGNPKTDNDPTVLCSATTGQWESTAHLRPARYSLPAGWWRE